MDDDASRFEVAVAAVRAGADPDAEAGGLYDRLTDDGAAGAARWRHPVLAGHAPRCSSGTTPARTSTARSIGSASRASGSSTARAAASPVHATAFPVTMARGATWDVDLEEASARRSGVRFARRAATSSAGCASTCRAIRPGAGSRRPTATTRTTWVSSAPRSPGAPQKYVMACAKHYALNSHGERAVHRRRERGRRDAARGVPAALQAGRRRGRRRDHGRLQLRERRVGGTEQLPADRRPARPVGLGTASPSRDFVWGLRDAAASLEAGYGPGGAVQPAAPRICADSSRPATTSWADGRACRSCVAGHPAALLRLPRSAATPRSTWSPTSSTAPWPARWPPAPWCCSRTSRSTPRRCCRWTSARALDRGRSAGWPWRRTWVTTARRTCWPPSHVTPLRRHPRRLPRRRVVTRRPRTTRTPPPRASRDADVAIVVAGFTAATRASTSVSTPSPTPRSWRCSPHAAGIGLDTSMARTPIMTTGLGGDRDSLRLRPIDEEIIHAVVAANPRTVVAVVAAGAVITEAWRHDVPAILVMWYAGMEGGHALADVLTGRHNPSGRLPFSMPTSEDTCRPSTRTPRRHLRPLARPAPARPARGRPPPTPMGSASRTRRSSSATSPPSWRRTAGSPCTPASPTPAAATVARSCRSTGDAPTAPAPVRHS